MNIKLLINQQSQVALAAEERSELRTGVRGRGESRRPGARETAVVSEIQTV